MRKREDESANARCEHFSREGERVADFFSFFSFYKAVG